MGSQGREPRARSLWTLRNLPHRLRHTALWGYSVTTPSCSESISMAYAQMPPVSRECIFHSSTMKLVDFQSFTWCFELTISFTNKLLELIKIRQFWVVINSTLFWIRRHKGGETQQLCALHTQEELLEAALKRGETTCFYEKQAQPSPATANEQKLLASTPNHSSISSLRSPYSIYTTLNVWN